MIDDAADDARFALNVLPPGGKRPRPNGTGHTGQLPWRNAGDLAAASDVMETCDQGIDCTRRTRHWTPTYT